MKVKWSQRFEFHCWYFNYLSTFSYLFTAYKFKLFSYTKVIFFDVWVILFWQFYYFNFYVVYLLILTIQTVTSDCVVTLSVKVFYFKSYQTLRKEKSIEQKKHHFATKISFRHKITISILPKTKIVIDCVL